MVSRSMINKQEKIFTFSYIIISSPLSSEISQGDTEQQHQEMLQQHKEEKKLQACLKEMEEACCIE